MMLIIQLTFFVNCDRDDSSDYCSDKDNLFIYNISRSAVLPSEL